MARFLEFKASTFRHVCAVFAFFLSASGISAAQIFSGLAAFNGTDGARPYMMSFVQGNDGYLYGTTSLGGTHNDGTIFKISTTGTSPTTLYSFCAQSNCTDGASPYAGLVLGSDGNFYGTANSGGDFGVGTIFKITPNGDFSVLHSFNVAAGANPYAGLVQGSDGNFYGTTSAGGSNDGYGTVFKITPGGNFTVLHSFSSFDGANPYAALVQGSDGDFYGTTSSGGTNGGYGTVFKVTSTGILTPLHSFNGADGQYPYAGLVQDTDGNFYGTTYGGGGIGDYGTVFVVTSTGILNTLHNFRGGDGQYLYAGLILATDGNFYGTTDVGGSNNQGTIFRITSTGILVTLYSFCSSNCMDGSEVTGGLLQANDANFYGTTYAGGYWGDGTVYSLSVPFSYTLTVSVTGGGTVTSTDGAINCPGTCSSLYPANAPVTLNATPGTGWVFTGWSGACSGSGPCNITMTRNESVTATFSQQSYLLSVSTAGGGTVKSTDHNINCPGTCGYSYSVNTPVTLSATAPTGWTFSGWGGACTGTGPCNVTMTQNLSVTATFIQDQGFYSLTVSLVGSGSVVSTDGSINCPGTCSNTYAGNTQVTLNATAGPGATFSGWSGACTGSGSCTMTMTQNLSVTGTFSGARQEMLSHSFGDGNDGQAPQANLIIGPDGKRYGTTSAGGMYGKGTVFKLSSDGTETVLYSFGNGTDGQNPYAGLIVDSSGNFYGTTSAGGPYGKAKRSWRYVSAGPTS